VFSIERPKIVDEMNHALRVADVEILCTDPEHEVPVVVEPSKDRREVECIACGGTIYPRDRAVYVPRYRTLQKNGKKRADYENGYVCADLKECLCSIVATKNLVEKAAADLREAVTLPTMEDLESQ
jgi:hypothetical protein